MSDPRPAPPASHPRPWTRLGGVISISAGMIFGAISPAALAAGAAVDEAAAGTAEGAAVDPLAEAQRHVRKAGDLRQQGLAASAIDHIETAFRLLDDTRRYRAARGQVIAKAYETLLEAYNQAATSDEKVRHFCRLRGLLKENIADLREAFGDEAEAFPEVRHGEQKIASVELTIRTHGDPEVLCVAPAPEGPLPTMPATTPLLLGSEETTKAPSPAVTEPRVGPEPEPEVDAEELVKTRRKAVAMTASGVSLMVASGALFGVMSHFIREGLRLNPIADAWDPTIDHTPKEKSDYIAVKEDGVRANALAYTTGALGTAALVTGLALTAIGGKRLRRGELSFAPTTSPTGAGATVTLRF